MMMSNHSRRQETTVPLDQRVVRALSRVTSTGMFIPVIDGLRFIAISSVFLYHLCGYVEVKVFGVAAGDLRMNDWLGLLLDRGWFGVNLFFVLSGFIIAIPFASHRLGPNGGERVSLKKYYLRRITRLEPPYIIHIVICFVLLMLVKDKTFGELWRHFLATLIYSHNIVYGGISIITAVTWSLEIEIQFYFIAPLIAAIFFVSNTLLRRGFLVALIITSAFVQPILRPHDTLSVLLYSHCFLTGFLLADVYLVSWKRQPVRTFRMDLWFAVASAALYFIVGHYEFVNWNPLGVFLACSMLFILCCGAFCGRTTTAVLSNRWIVVIGGMCYTIYLYHMHIYSLIGRLTKHLHVTDRLWVNILIQGFLIVPAMLLISGALFVLCEKPFMRREWPKTFFKEIRKWLVRMSQLKPEIN